jgi:hypothetical protein
MVNDNNSKHNNQQKQEGKVVVTATTASSGVQGIEGPTLPALILKKCHKQRQL